MARHLGVAAPSAAAVYMDVLLPQLHLLPEAVRDAALLRMLRCLAELQQQDRGFMQLLAQVGFLSAGDAAAVSISMESLSAWNSYQHETRMHPIALSDVHTTCRWSGCRQCWLEAPMCVHSSMKSACATSAARWLQAVCCAPPCQALLQMYDASPGSAAAASHILSLHLLPLPVTLPPLQTPLVPNSLGQLHTPSRVYDPCVPELVVELCDLVCWSPFSLTSTSPCTC